MNDSPKTDPAPKPTVDERPWSSLTSARWQLAVRFMPACIEAVSQGRMNKPTKKDGTPINPHFRAALNARNFADALLRAMDERKPEGIAEEKGGEL
jgi:hypothetical protein